MKERSARPRIRRAGGYTLIELMITVTIVGILSAIAIPSFVGYLRKSKTSEAISFLGAIKERQAAYFAEMGQYCNVDQPNPGTMPTGGDTARWTASSSWASLGAAPDAASLYFQYDSIAGAPSDSPSSHTYFATNRGFSGSDFWFISRAVGDLDGDGDVVTFESYSGNAALWISHSAGYD